MTDHQKNLDMLRTRVKTMREGEQPDHVIYAGLLAEGWSAEEVQEAMYNDDGHMERVD